MHDSRDHMKGDNGGCICDISGDVMLGMALMPLL